LTSSLAKELPGNPINGPGFSFVSKHDLPVLSCRE
jgi:hypothetical protein